LSSSLASWLIGNFVSEPAAVDLATASVITLSHLVVWDAEVHHRLSCDELKVLGIAATEISGVVGWV
jgi:hypothetical protein